MKRLVLFVLIVLIGAVPAWAAKKTTVQELKEMLLSFQEAKKGDEYVASQLKQIELSEELTTSALTSLLPASPGPLTSEQIFILEARSSMLVPPPSDLPDLPSPDDAAQKAMQDKAIGLLAESDRQYPRMTASRTTSRIAHKPDFKNATGRHGYGDQSILSLTSKYTEIVEIDHGIEKVPVSALDPRLRRISPTSESGARPDLSPILRQAAEDGSIHWLRWETVSGVKTAVFSFSADKGKSPYAVDYCCFQTLGQVGSYDWKPFKKIVGLHGELFIDPDSGTIVRLIAQAELKPTDFVQLEDARIDYGMVTIDGHDYLVPVDSFTHTEVLSSGDSNQGYLMRRTFLVAGYGNYRLAGAAQK